MVGFRSVPSIGHISLSNLKWLRKENNIWKRELTCFAHSDRSKNLSNRFSWISIWTLKKIPSKNIFSSWRKISLKKKSSKKKLVFSIFFHENWFFSSKHLLEIFWFFNRKNQNVRFFVEFVFQNYFSPWCKNIFRWDFF